MSILLQLIKVVFKRITFTLIAIILLVSTTAAVMYIINPYNINSTNIRPRIFGYDIYRIPSKSMQPGLVPGDYILVSNIAYASKQPNRNDIIVFNKHLPTESNIKTPYIKRILALQGDTIKIENGRVFVNDQIIIEPYVNKKNNRRDYSQKMDEIFVPSRKVFVIGDNRDNSNDSRTFGVVSTSEIIGKATSILYGINGRTGNEIK